MELTKNDKINKYHNAKLYTIRSHQTDKYYIGSTCSPLHKRLYEHKNNFKMFQVGKYHNVSSFEIIKYDDCYIELYEAFKCENRNELTKREGEIIRLLKNELVNVKIEGRTEQQYRKDNADKIKQNKKQYYVENADKIKQYYVDNAEKLKQKNICICGTEYSTSNKSHHLKSKKHINYIEKTQKNTLLELEKFELEKLEIEFNKI